MELHYSSATDANAGEYRPGASFFAYLGLNLAFVAVAALMVFIEPVSAGSGIPEVSGPASTEA